MIGHTCRSEILGFIVIPKYHVEFSTHIIKCTKHGLSNRQLICMNTGILDKPLKHEGFVWTIDSSFTGRFVIEIEFLDLKVADSSVSTVSPSTFVFVNVWYNNN